MSEKNLPLMKPLLPKASSIIKYIEEIDRNRWYSNFGPLVNKFEQNLAELFQTEAETIVTFSNATAALSSILKALNLKRNTLCICPSWTFVATPASIVEAGLIPIFLDVDEDSWSFEPEQIIKQLPNIKGKIGALIVVSSFGSPTNIAKWDKFTEQTNIPVIIDAAAAFDATINIEKAKIGQNPIVISFHATKSFGIGEGGMVLSKNKELITTLKTISNYGFTATRDVLIAGVNSKLSEYNAAVGLAALEEWPQKRAAWALLTNHYIELLNSIIDKKIVHHLSNDWVSSVCNIRITNLNTDLIIDELKQLGIESRAWWKSCHKKQAYQHYPKLNLDISEKLSNSIIALPFSVDMNKEDVAYVVNGLNLSLTKQLEFFI